MKFLFITLLMVVLGGQAFAQTIQIVDVNDTKHYIVNEPPVPSTATMKDIDREQKKLAQLKANLDEAQIAYDAENNEIKQAQKILPVEVAVIDNADLNWTNASLITP